MSERGCSAGGRGSTSYKLLNSSVRCSVRPLKAPKEKEEEDDLFLLLTCLDWKKSGPPPAGAGGISGVRIDSLVVPPSLLIKLAASCRPIGHEAASNLNGIN